MSQRYQIIPFLMLFRREVQRFLRVMVQTVVTPMVSSLLYLVVFGVSLGAMLESQNGVDYLAFLIPGLMMMGLMNNAFQNSSSSIVSAKFTGELEDLRVVPLTRNQIISAIALASVVRGAVVALSTFAVGFVFYWIQKSELLWITHPLEFLFFVLIGGLVFGLLGFSAAIWAKTFDQLSAVSAFILLPLSYLGGVFISVQSLHPFWQKVSVWNPVFYFINGLRHAVLGVSDVEVGTCVAVSLFAVLLFYGISYWSIQKGSFQRW